MRSKPILFVDFDGTICMDRYWRSLPAQEHEAVQELLFRQDTRMVNEWMRGKYTAEEVNQYVAEHIGISYDYLWGIFVQDCKNMYVAPEMLSKLNELRAKYTVILITGNMDSFTRFTQPVLGLEEYFDVISNSFYEGRHKTDDDGAIFIKYVQQYKANIAECILLDDSSGACKVFKKLGGKALQVSERRDVVSYLTRNV